MAGRRSVRPFECAFLRARLAAIPTWTRRATERKVPARADRCWGAFEISWILAIGSLDTRGRHCRATESDEATVGQATRQPNPDEACGYAVHGRRAATDVLLVPSPTRSKCEIAANAHPAHRGAR